MDKIGYLKAKIFALSGQPKFRGTGVKRTYNCFFDYAYIELKNFINNIANMPNGRKKAVRIARQFKKLMNDPEEMKKSYVVCPISERQAFVLAEFADEFGIDLLNYPEIENEEE